MSEIYRVTRAGLIKKNTELSGEVVELSGEVADLSDENKRLRKEREDYKKLYQQTMEQCRKLELGIMGQKAEKLTPNESQLTMSVLQMLFPGEDSPATPKKKEEQEKPSGKEKTRKKHPGRRPLPEALPRVEIEIIPEEVKEHGLEAFERIGEEVTETLERRVASLIVVRTIRPKFVRKDREKNADTEVLCGDLPELPIIRGMAGPGLIAQTIVQRWQDHMPLHRLESIYRREGIDLARQTIGGWHMTLADLCKPLYAAMMADCHNSPYLCTDATGVLVQAKRKCENGHFWILLAPDKHAMFAFSKKHNKAAVDILLENYQGYLVADAHTVYDHLYTTGEIVEVGCWAHLRRYFYKAIGSEPDLALFALAIINRLFEIERTIRSLDPESRKRVRAEQSEPLVTEFFGWCDREALLAIDSTPIASAIKYARNQADAFKRFLEDGQLPLHNNGSERGLRRHAVGRKNWLFVGSEDGGHANAIFVSLLASCQMHDIEPWAYLRDLLCLLPNWNQRSVLDLAPAYFKQTQQKPETQELLNGNVFRQALLLDSLDTHTVSVS